MTKEYNPLDCFNYHVAHPNIDPDCATCEYINRWDACEYYVSVESMLPVTPDTYLESIINKEEKNDR